MHSRASIKLRILAPYAKMATFIQDDFDILNSKHQVIPVQCNTLPDMFKALWKVFSADCLFCWFGSPRFLPLVMIARMLGRKIIIIAGGYDVAAVPEIAYGNMCSGIKKYAGRLLFWFAHSVAAVSSSNFEQAIKHARVHPKKLVLIYHGLDHNFFYLDESAALKKERIVVTVGSIKMDTIITKGILNVVKISRLLPEIPFVIVGHWDNDALEVLKNNMGDNVRFTGYLNRDELQRQFMNAKVYLQPSLHESFGRAVAEAMLYNCIPVVSNRFALPEVIGASGFSVDPYNLDEIAVTVTYALNVEADQFPETPRQRIIRMFPAATRREHLLQLVEKTCGF